ncbi:MAG: phosphotransferase family protein [Acidimicrobiia bacterium]
MVAGGQRDPESLRPGLERWFRSHHEPGPATVASIARPTTGLSCETLFVELAYDGARTSGRETVVVRLPPAGAGLFPEYDFAAQARVQQRLASTEVPVAAPALHEPDTSWIGCDFLVMPRVPGRVVTTFPSFLASGWLAAAPVGYQRAVQRGFFDVLASLHRIDHASLGLDHLARGSSPFLAAELSWWSDYLAWATDGSPLPELAAGLTWCRDRVPLPEPPPSLLWGDVQLANAVFTDDGSTGAIVDWEMASIGPAELDLGWYFALHDMTVAANGGTDLPGFTGRDVVLAGYSERLGRPVTDLAWYETFALVRSGAIMQRVARLLGARGVDDSWLTRGNPTIERLRHLPV